MLLFILLACSPSSVPTPAPAEVPTFARLGPAPGWILGPDGEWEAADGSRGPLASLSIDGTPVFTDQRQPDRITRQGLRLSAEQTFAWTGELPPEPVFDAFVVSDSAVRLEVLTDGAPVSLSHAPSPAGTRWRVPLDGASGEATVRLSVSDGSAFLSGAAVLPARVDTPRRVVVIGLDTTRPDHLSLSGYGRETTPNLKAFAEQAVVFPTTWAPAPRTRPSFRTATTGRWPLQAVGATNLGAVFKAAGFATAGIVANPHLVPRYDFNDGFDYWRMDGTSVAEQQVDLALAFLEEQSSRDAFLFLHLMDPHLRYKAPAPFAERWVEGPATEEMARWTRSRVYALERRGKLSEEAKRELEARYDGEIAYTDAQLGRLFTALDAMEGETLVVVHSDHGEEFWEHGGYEHNHTLYEEVVRALLVIRPPGLERPLRPGVRASLADIVPTVLSLVGLDAPEGLDGQDLVPTMGGKTPEWADRPLPLGFLRYNAEQWGVVHQGHKYILTTGSGDEQFFDLATDPGEQRNLAAEHDLDPWRQALAEAHGIPVGPGWRIRVDLDGAEPLTVELPAVARAAGVFDPWRLQRVRENLVWGEQRRSALPEEVASVALSEDGRQLIVTPGTVGKGTIWVRFAEPEPLGGTVRFGEEQSPVEASVALAGQRLRFEPGTVLEPSMHEADRIALLQQQVEEADEDELRLLEQLGYIGPE